MAQYTNTLTVSQQLDLIAELQSTLVPYSEKWIKLDELAHEINVATDNSRPIMLTNINN